MGAEKKLEKRCMDIAKANGWYTRKWSSPSNRGVPDRIFLKEGEVIFVEFKAPGKVPTPLHEHEIHLINKYGGDAFCCDDADAFKVWMGIDT